MTARVTWPSKASHKYHAQPRVLDGRRFDSTAEARRYAELLLLQRAGHIRNLTCQPSYPLCTVRHRPAAADPEVLEVAAYVADFAYDEQRDQAWTPVVEDVKGWRTSIYRLKRRWFELQYGLSIRETR